VLADVVLAGSGFSAADKTDVEADIINMVRLMPADKVCDETGRCCFLVTLNIRACDVSEQFKIPGDIVQHHAL